MPNILSFGAAARLQRFLERKRDTPPSRFGHKAWTIVPSYPATPKTKGNSHSSMESPRPVRGKENVVGMKAVDFYAIWRQAPYVCLFLREPKDRTAANFWGTPTFLRPAQRPRRSASEAPPGKKQKQKRKGTLPTTFQGHGWTVPTCGKRQPCQHVSWKAPTSGIWLEPLKGAWT